MPVAANITAPAGTQSGNFNVTVTFASAVEDFTAADITIAAVSGNGITGVTFDVTGSGMTYNVPFQLPEDVSGSLQIRITGQVTVSGVSESVTATARTVAYDNITSVAATFGTVAYRDNGVLAVPVTFAKAVLAPAKSIFQITRGSGDALTDMRYRLVGEGTAYELIFEIPPDRNGRFRIACDGDVLQKGTLLWDNIACSQKTVTYDTRVPFIENYDIPASYVHGEKFDVVLQFNVPVTFISPKEKFGSDDATYLDHFIFEGADLGLPTLYRKKNNTYPTGDIGTVSDTDPAPPTADWGDPSTVIPSEIYLLRYAQVNTSAVGIFNITLKAASVRGPSGALPPAQERNYLADGSGHFLGDGNGNYLGTGS